MRRTVAALVALATILAARAALADGDPASDVLVGQNVFLPYPAPSDAAASALNTQVAAVWAAGERVKVAVIAAPTDLGAIPSLFGQPSEYARFLGTELRFVYVGPLLVVMPAGYAIYDGGRPTTAEDIVLDREPSPGPSADDLTQGAARAVSDLLAAKALRSPDVLPPEVFVLTAYGFPGKPLALHYRLADDSGRASAIVQLRRGAKAVATFAEPMTEATSFLQLRTVVWRVPASLAPGRLRYCVTATDPAGNRGRDCKIVQILGP